jgi:cbb3-type cytochrome oxidase maturation protein
MVGSQDVAGMSVIVLLIVAGGAVAAGFLGAFVWAVRSGQFDDTCTPAVRILFDGSATRRPFPAIVAQMSATSGATRFAGETPQNDESRAGVLANDMERLRTDVDGNRG